MPFRLALSAASMPPSRPHRHRQQHRQRRDHRLQGLARRVRRPVRGLPAGRQRHGHRQRRARLERRRSSSPRATSTSPTTAWTSRSAARASSSLNDGGALSYTRAGAFQVDNAGLRRERQAAAPAGVSAAAPMAASTPAADGPAASSRARARRPRPRSVDVMLNLPASATRAADRDRSIRRTRRATTTRPRSRCTTRSAPRTPRRCTSSKTRDRRTTWTTHLYVDGTAVGGAQTLDLRQHRRADRRRPTATITFPALHAGDRRGADQHDLRLRRRPRSTATTSRVNSITQDGFTTGRLIGIDIDSSGVVQARFTNGRSLALGQVALANFAEPAGPAAARRHAAGPRRSARARRCAAQAGNSGFGLVQSGALEASNVDITEQLVNMITAQRNFQANAQMISTADSITQTIINIR